MSDPPAFVVCEVIPRSTCCGDELKALAEALARWHEGLSGYEWNCGVHFVLHDLDLADLRRGELPLPAGLKVASNLRQAQELLRTSFPLPTMREATTALGARRSVCLLGQATQHYSEDALFSSLRHFIPAELVADVRIDATSWKS